MNTYCLWIFFFKLEKIRKKNLLEKLEIKEIKRQTSSFGILKNKKMKQGGGGGGIFKKKQKKKIEKKRIDKNREKWKEIEAQKDRDKKKKDGETRRHRMSMTRRYTRIKVKRKV